jgi:hypothetical protein
MIYMLTTSSFLLCMWLLNLPWQLYPSHFSASVLTAAKDSQRHSPVQIHVYDDVQSKFSSHDLIDTRYSEKLGHQAVNGIIEGEFDNLISHGS